MISHRTAETGFAIGTALFGALIAWGATEFGTGWSASGPEPGTFPFYVGCIITLASLGNIFFAIRSHRAADEPFMTRQQAMLILQFVVPMIVFVVLSLFLGLYVATAIYLFAVMIVQGRYPVWHAALVAAGLPVFLYLLLEKGFQVQLLKGPLEAVLGL